MKRIFIDIETLPTEENNREFVERKLHKNLFRRGLKFTETEISERTKIAFQDTALHGSLGKLLCIGLAIDNEGKAEKPCVCGQDKNTGAFHLDEAKTLAQFWNHLDRIKFDASRDLIVGHNILGFDLPFLYHRSMICGVKPSRQILNGKPWEIAESVYDTMDRWQMGKYYEKISLEELALAFGLDCPKKGAVNGKNLLEAYSEGKHEEIREYCLKDVLCARGLYYKMTFQTMPEFSVEKTIELTLND
ncbi:MAG: 3'-5' exonuclease [Pyrinomonadaceae bacterium]